MGKKVSKVFNKVLKNTVGGSSGIFDQFLGTDFTGKKADAAKAAEEAQRRQEQLLANANVDLGLNNAAVAEVGGTADLMSDTTKRKRRTGTGGIAASLGINV